MLAARTDDTDDAWLLKTASSGRRSPSTSAPPSIALTAQPLGKRGLRRRSSGCRVAGAGQELPAILAAEDRIVDGLAHRGDVVEAVAIVIEHHGGCITSTPRISVKLLDLPDRRAGRAIQHRGPTADPFSRDADDDVARVPAGESSHTDRSDGEAAFVERAGTQRSAGQACARPGAIRPCHFQTRLPLRLIPPRRPSGRRSLHRGRRRRGRRGEAPAPPRCARAPGLALPAAEPEDEKAPSAERVDFERPVSIVVDGQRWVQRAIRGRSPALEPLAPEGAGGRHRRKSLRETATPLAGRVSTTKQRRPPPDSALSHAIALIRMPGELRGRLIRLTQQPSCHGRRPDDAQPRLTLPSRDTNRTALRIGRPTRSRRKTFTRPSPSIAAAPTMTSPIRLVTL